MNTSFSVPRPKLDLSDLETSDREAQKPASSHLHFIHRDAHPMSMQVIIFQKEECDHRLDGKAEDDQHSRHRRLSHRGYRIQLSTLKSLESSRAFSADVPVNSDAPVECRQKSDNESPTREHRLQSHLISGCKKPKPCHKNKQKMQSLEKTSTNRIQSLPHLQN